MIAPHSYFSLLDSIIKATLLQSLWMYLHQCDVCSCVCTWYELLFAPICLLHFSLV